jgi:hypothetical protein
MYPTLLDGYVSAHRSELRTQLSWRRRRTRAGPFRQRIGWFLIECGLRLVAADGR